MSLADSGCTATLSQGRPHQTSLRRILASGVTIVDSEGKEYLDFAGGYGVFTLGHRHPRVIAAVKAQLDILCWRVSNRQMPVAEVCLLKNLGTAMLEEVAGEAVQIFGGAGYLRGAKVERIFRETKVLSIGGGASEIMNHLRPRPRR